MEDKKSPYSHKSTSPIGPAPIDEEVLEEILKQELSAWKIKSCFIHGQLILNSKYRS